MGKGDIRRALMSGLEVNVKGYQVKGTAFVKWREESLELEIESGGFA